MSNIDIDSMEIGKNYSLSQGISIRRNKDKTLSYIGSYRDLNSKSKRKVLMTKNRHLKKHIKESLGILEDFKQNFRKQIEIKETILPSGAIFYEGTNNNLTLNQLATRFFQSKMEDLTAKLKQQYNYQTEKEFLNNRVVQLKLYNKKKQELKYNKNIKPSLYANIPTELISKKDIHIFLKEYLPTLGLSQKTSFDLISQIKSIYNFSIRHSIINIQSPFINVFFKNPKNQREAYLTPKQIKLLLDTAKEYKRNPNVYLSIYLAIQTAGREQTILNIRKKDINFDNNYISLQNFKVNSNIYKIPINEKCKNYLKELTEDYEYEEYLIRPYLKNYKQNKKTGYKPLTRVPKQVFKIMDKLFNEGRDKTNNQDRNYIINFHSLRRSVATNLALNQESIYKIQTLLNHSSIKQTEEYLNLSAINSLDSMNNFNNLIYE